MLISCCFCCLSMPSSANDVNSLIRWTHWPMTPVEGCPTVFQTICSLPPGFHQVCAVNLAFCSNTALKKPLPFFCYVGCNGKKRNSNVFHSILFLPGNSDIIFEQFISYQFRVMFHYCLRCLVFSA